jgi:hypothetical protein
MGGEERGERRGEGESERRQDDARKSLACNAEAVGGPHDPQDTLNRGSLEKTNLTVKAKFKTATIRTH